METVKIYLAGGMTQLPFDDQTAWRQKVRDAILYGGYDYDFKPIFINPVQYYNFEEPSHKSEREVFEFDLHKVRTSDLVIVNFNDPRSIGTAMELAIAKENKIPVVGLNKDNKELHPWLKECCTRICDDMHELVEYVVEYFLK